MGGCLAENERCVVGRMIVITDYSAQDVPALNRGNSTGGVTCDRRLLRQALIGAGGVVVVNVRIQDRPQVPLAENQDVVKAFLARAADPTLGDGVRIWCLKRRVNDVEPLGLKHGAKVSRELAIVVVDQEPFVGSLFLECPHHLPGLLGNPPSVRMGRHARKRDASRAQFDEEENIQGLQPQCLHGEEVAGQQLLPVMTHQLPPADGAVAHRRWQNVVAVENVANGAGRDREA